MRERWEFRGNGKKEDERRSETRKVRRGRKERKKKQKVRKGDKEDGEGK